VDLFTADRAPRPQPRAGAGRSRAFLYAAGVAKQGLSNAQLLSTLASQAVDSLAGTQYAIADAIDHVINTACSTARSSLSVEASA